MSQTLTSMSIQKRNKERVNLFLDGDYAFSIGLNAALGLKRGQVLSAADIERLQREDDVQRAYHQGLRLLGYRPRSRAEVERHLRQKGYGPDAIAAALERLRAKRYLDDEAFAQSWRENRDRLRPRGARALRHELRQKGGATETIDEVLTDMDEDASAWAALEGKLERWRGLDREAYQKKAMSFLSRRGFGYGAVRAACRKGWEFFGEDHDD